MEYALIKDGVVANVIVADDEFVSLIADQWDHIERIDTPEEAALGVGIGWGWDGSNFVAPEIPVMPEPEPPVWQWYIDIGPFFDRFGATKMAVLTSADSGVQAILKDLQIRKWLDLKLPEVAQSLAYVGEKVPGVNAELQTAILTTPVSDNENLALRKLYFS